MRRHLEELWHSFLGLIWVFFVGTYMVIAIKSREVQAKAKGCRPRRS